MLSLSIIISCGICIVATATLGLHAKSVCEFFSLMDVPDERKKHRVATPLLGGLTLVGIVLPLAASLTGFYLPQVWHSTLFLIIIATGGMTLLGLADDRHTLSASARLFWSLAIFATAAIIDPDLNVRVLKFANSDFELGLATGFIAVFFTTICCVGLINAVNMADGKNGLVIGLCIGWLAVLSVRAPEPIVPVIFLALCALVTLLAFNLSGRMFLGDGGAYGFASLIAMLTIATYNSPGEYAGQAIGVEDVILLFALPVIDSFRLAFVRVRRGLSPMTADRDHLHHHLQAMVPWPWNLVSYLAMSVVPPFIYQVSPIGGLVAVIAQLSIYAAILHRAHGLSTGYRSPSNPQRVE